MTTRTLTVSKDLVDRDWDRVEVFCDTCRRVVSRGRRYQCANGHDADQHVRLFHAEASA